MIVVLDPGHGGANEGAPARYRAGQFEKDFTLPIARAVERLLKKEGITVKLTRTVDEEVALLDRVGFANRVGADVMVSIHLNSSKKPGPSGPITFLLSAEASDESSRRLALLENEEPTVIPRVSNVRTADPKVRRILLDLSRQKAHDDSVKLARFIQRHIDRKSPFTGRGVRQAPFYVLMGAAMPAVVAEIGFINHPKEGRFITSKLGMNAIAGGIANGILEFRKLVHQPKYSKSGESK